MEKESVSNELEKLHKVIERLKNENFDLLSVIDRYIMLTDELNNKIVQLEADKEDE